MDRDQDSDASSALRNDPSSLSEGSPFKCLKDPLAEPGTIGTMVMRPLATKLRNWSPGRMPASRHWSAGKVICRLELTWGMNPTVKGEFGAPLSDLPSRE